MSTATSAAAAAASEESLFMPNQDQHLDHHSAVLTSSSSSSQWLNTAQNHAIIIFSAMALCSFLNLVSARLSHRWSKSYRNLNVNKRIEWDSRMVSNLNALFSLFVVFPSIFSPQYAVNPVETATEFSNFGTLFMIGYFLYDIALVLRHWEVLGSKGILVHHVQSAVSAYWFVCKQCGVYFYVLMSITEITTPFVNLRWFLSVSGWRSSRLYVYNGVVMWFLFGVFRLGAVIHICIRIKRWWSLFMAAPFSCNVLMAAAFGVLSLLNIHWFYIMTNGLIKVLFPERQRNKGNKKS